MRTVVRVDGVDIEQYGTVGDLEDSTIWRTEGYSGDYEFSCTWGAPADFSAPWLHAGAFVEIVVGGVVEWTGFLGDPGQGEPWQLSGFGTGADAANYASEQQLASATNGNVDSATARGMLFSRYTNDLTGGAWQSAPSEQPLMLDEALNRTAKGMGTVWWVSLGEVSMRTESTVPTWMLAPGSTYLGTTDDEMVTDLIGYYQISSGIYGTVAPAAASDSVARARFGRRERIIDLTPLGTLTSTDASAIVVNRFAYVGARAGWTNGFEMDATNTLDITLGVGDPMLVRAGQRVRLSGLTDARSSASYRESVDVTLGRVRRIHAEARAICEPVGLVARDFSGALAAAQPAPTNVEEF